MFARVALAKTGLQAQPDTEQLRSAQQAKAVQKGAKVAMACTKCKTVQVTDVDRQKSFLSWFEPKTKHVCPGCGGYWGYVVYGKGSRHGDYIHTHPHSHEPERHSHSPQETPLVRLDRSLGSIGAYQLLRPLIVGVVHGLAGSAAAALLILASIRNSSWAIAYLFLFGLGTIAGMMLITMSIASTFRLAGNRFQHFSRRLALASGLVSLIFGLFLAYQIGVVQGLFSTHPQWTPR